MVDGFTTPQIIATLVVTLVASYAAFFGWLASIAWITRSIHTLDRKFDAKFDGLAAKTDVRSNGLDAKIDARADALGAKIDALSVAVSRLDGLSPASSSLGLRHIMRHTTRFINDYKA